MRREAKLLLATVLFGGVLSIGASTSGHTGLSIFTGRDLAPSGVQACQFTTNDVFDTKWNQDLVSTSVPLQVSSLNYPISDSGAASNDGFGTVLSASDYAPGDYFALVNNADSSTYALDLYGPDGTLLQTVDATGTIYLIGANYLFYVGDAYPGGNGTILTTSPSLNLAIGGSASVSVNAVSPSTSAIDDAFDCASGAPGLPTVTAAQPHDQSATLTWTSPPTSGSSVVSGYEVYAHDVTDPANDSTQAASNVSTTGTTNTAIVTGLTDGDAYTFSVAATNDQGTGSYSDPSTPPVIPDPIANDPTGVSVSQGNQYLAVSWTYPAEESGAANYEVVGLDQTNSANDVSYQCPANPDSDALSETCSVPGVTVGDDYVLFVEALNTDGDITGVSVALPPTPVISTPFDDPVGVSADATHAWFANYVGGPDATGSVTMVTTSSGAVSEIDSPDFVNPDAISSDGTHVWVVNQNGGTGNGSVTELSASTGAVVQNITLSDFNDPVAISSDGTDVWVLNQFGGGEDGYNGAIVELDAATGAEVQYLTSSFLVDPVAIAADGTHVWVADQSGEDSGDVLDYNVADNSFTDLTPSGLESPDAIATDGTHVWVADNPGDGSGSVFELEASSGDEVRHITDASLTYPVAISTSGAYVWVANSDGYGSSGGEVSRVTVSSGAVSEQNDASIDDPTGIAASGATVWLSDSMGGTYGLGNYSELVAKTVPSTPSIAILPSSGVAGQSFTAVVTTTSDGVTSVTSSTPTVCTASGLSVNFVGAGTCTLQSSVAASGTYYAATGATQSVDVSSDFGVTATTTTTTSTTTTTVPPTTTTTTSTTSTTTTTVPSTTTTTLGTTTTVPSTTTTTNSGSPAQTTTTTSTTTTTTTTTTIPPTPTPSIAFCGAPGVSIVGCTLTIEGQGAEPNTVVTVVVHSTPTKVGASSVQSNGTFDVRGSLPANLPVGVHHVIVNGTSLNGNPFREVEVFTVIKGERLGSIGWVPPTPLQGDVQFLPTAHRTIVLAATAGVTAAAAAVSSGLGGGLAFGGGGSAPVGGGSGGSGAGAGASLESVEIERLEGEMRDDGPGDRSKFWRWPGTRFLDRWSKYVPRKVATVSPVVSRVLVDGDYLRAVLGSFWIGLCLASIGLGAYASATSGWYAVPPSLGLFIAILALGIFDSTLGFLAGLSFLASSVFAGHVTSAPEIRLSFGLMLVWFAVPLAAAALRPLRRAVSLRIDSLWERAADLVVCGLFAAWVAEKMTSALSGLAGVTLPINSHVGTIVIAVLVLIALRVILETIVVHLFPLRLASVRHEGPLESGNVQKVVSFVAQIVVFVFVAVAFLGATWALYLGTIVFFTPLFLDFFDHRFPKSRAVAKWKPNGILTWTLIICAGLLLGELLNHTVHNGHLVEEIGFIVLPLPVLAFWMIELFEEKEEEKREEAEVAHEQSALHPTSAGGRPKGRTDALSQEDGRSPRRRQARGADDAGETEVDQPVLAMASARRATRGVVASSPQGSGAEVAPANRRSAKVAEVEVKELEVESAPYDPVRSANLRKWASRMAGVALVIVSVLLVHFQGGG